MIITMIGELTMAFGKKDSTRKGQAAMEYLMTYGWAILVIVIVLAVLLFLNPFKAPETCLFAQPGFTCSDPMPQVYNDGSSTMVAMKIGNKQGQTVTIKRVLCTTASVSEVDKTNPSAKTVSDDVGAGAFWNGTATCDSLTQANSQFKGSLVIWYNFKNDPDQTIERQASATLISTVFNK